MRALHCRPAQRAVLALEDPAPWAGAKVLGRACPRHVLPADAALRDVAREGWLGAEVALKGHHVLGVCEGGRVHGLAVRVMDPSERDGPRRRV